MLKTTRPPDYFVDLVIYGLIMFIVGGVVHFYTLNVPGVDFAVQETRIGLLAFLGFILAAAGALLSIVSAFFWYLAKIRSIDT